MNATEEKLPDIEIDLTPEKSADKNEDVVIDSEAPAEKGKQALTVDLGIDELKRQLAEEGEKRKLAEQRAQAASQELTRARGETEETQLTLVKNGLQTVKDRAVQLKNEYANALAENDYVRVAELQEQISENVIHKQRLEEGVKSLENRPKPQAELDPVEAAARELTPRSAAWIRAHPEYIRDQRLYSKLVSAHNIAMADGVQVDSDDYFRSVEETLRIKPPVETENETEVEAMGESAKVTGGRRSSPPPAAPVSRSTPATGVKPNPNRVTLTSAERETAEALGMTVQEYAKNKLALQREGKLN